VKLRKDDLRKISAERGYFSGESGSKTTCGLVELEKDEIKFISKIHACF